MNWFRRLYNWVLHWSETPYGPIALFILALTEASFFPVPPDPLLMALALGTSKKSFRFALICTVGSVFGGLIGYLIGFQFWSIVGEMFLTHIISPKLFFKTQELYHQNAFLSIFVSGFTPIPYKVFTVSAGVFKLDLGVFIVASLLGRSLRFFLVAAIIYFFGQRLKDLIEKYFELFTVLFVVLLIGGFIFVKHLLH